MKGMIRAEKLVDAAIQHAVDEAVIGDKKARTMAPKARTKLIRHIRALRARERMLTARLADVEPRLTNLRAAHGKLLEDLAPHGDMLAAMGVFP